MNTPPPVPRRCGAFTLVETLVVVAVIVLILVLSAPSFLGTMQASRLSSAGDTVVGVFSEAQQMAMSLNVPVEIRFFKYSTPDHPDKCFRSFMMFKVNVSSEPGASQVAEQITPVGGVTRLPDGVVILPDKTLSPLLTGTGTAEFPDQGSSGSGGSGGGGSSGGKDGTTSYSGVAEAVYAAARFMTDGSCRLVGASTAGLSTLTYPVLQDSYITLVLERPGASEMTASDIPKNFYSIQVDPYTSKTRTYRPGQY